MNSVINNPLDQSVKYIKSVGPKRADSFCKIGIVTIRDLIFYFPARYLDRTNIINTSKIYELVINGYDGEVTIIGKVIDKEVIHYARKQILKVQLKDTSGFFECVWFQGIKFFQNAFNPGEFYAVSAKPVLTKYGNLQFVHPDFDKITENESQQFLNTGKIIPFYRVSKELRSTNIGDFSLRRIIKTAVESYKGTIIETLPERIVHENNLMEINNAVINVHFPESFEKLTQALTRFKFEEFFFLEVIVALRKIKIKSHDSAVRMEIKSNKVARFLKSLPFELTKSQLNVLSEIRKDLESNKPMNRLLQGDVGSGKTIVALIAMLIAVDNKTQSVFMVPTEILADQHFRNFLRMLDPFGINISILIGGQKKSERKKILDDIEKGAADIIIGTHALLEENVLFNKLGIVVIDEQHRFGVAQRSNLIRKALSPHIIIMTATPIPRTLTMTVYGDLDVSVITEMPQGRKPIKTLLRGEKRLPQIYKFILEKQKDNYRSLIVFPLVKESEKLDLKAAEIFYEELKNVFPEEDIGLIHGQMRWEEKENAMKQFTEGKTKVLVATTVIEVGIDVPEANIIVINDAHRFGLSQLHQLRGRIGRSNVQAYCILVTKDDYAKNQNLKFELDYLSSAQKERNKSAIRMQSMLKYSSGFDIAEIDLKLRGPGDIFGIKQSGFPELKHADIIKDQSLLIQAKNFAFKIIEEDKRLILPENKIIRDTLLTYYKSNLNYIQVA